MKLKAIALGGAAALALTLGASAGFAQTTTASPTTNDQSAPAQSAPADATTATPSPKPATHHYRHHMRSSKTADETPAERAQTVDLNKQELAKVDNQSSTSVAGNNTAGSTSNMTAQNAPATADAATMSTAHNAPSAPDASAAATTTAQNAPATNETSPNNDSNSTKLAQANSSAQTNAAAGANAQAAASGSMSGASMAKRQSLDSVSNPKSTLASATVQNSNGQSIGQVKKISVGSNGKTQAVDVQIHGQGGASTKTIRLDANDLSYDKDNNVLVTPLSSDQLNNMPSSPM